MDVVWEDMVPFIELSHKDCGVSIRIRHKEREEYEIEKREVQ